MKIAIYSPKGGSGKTPLAICYAVDKDFALVTNESYDVLSGYLDESRLLFVEAGEQFPDFPNDYDLVFDLAGTMTANDYSTLSALQQADVVVVPIWNNKGALVAGLKAIHAAHDLGKPVVVAATKLQSKTKKKGQTWLQSGDYQTVLEWVDSVKNDIGYMPPVMPVKFSDTFETVISECTSISALSASSGLYRHSQKELVSQLNELYAEIENHGKE